MSKAQLERGDRLVELLKQSLQRADAGRGAGRLDLRRHRTATSTTSPSTDVKRFETELLDYIRTRHGAMLEEIRTKGTLPDGVRDAVAAFKDDFAAGFGEAAIADPLATDADALAEAESDETLATE